MNLPNKLTVLRIILIPFLAAALLADFPCHYLAALFIFIAASITDMLDGKIARKKNMVTNFGKFSDPLADKILVSAVLLCFVQRGLCDCVLVIVVLFREFGVMSVRLLAAAQGKVVAANMWGKVKTVSQMIAVILIFVLQFALELMTMGAIPVSASGLALHESIFLITGQAALWISTVFCIISGAVYFYDNRQFINQK